MDTETDVKRISISRENLPKVIAKAFELSQPQGMGFLHFRAGRMPDEVLQQILDRSDSARSTYLRRVALDYVEGRAVKLCIHFDEGAGCYYLEDTGRWYDHSSEAWAELVSYAEGVQA